MSNYCRFNKCNNISNVRNQQRKENITISSTTEKEEKENIMDDLIIDDNTIYEIDQDCYEKARKSRISQRQGWDRR